MWLSFVAPIVMAMIMLNFVFELCGARARKNPLLLFYIGLVTAVAGVALWWFTENFAENLIYICRKITPRENCSLVINAGDLTIKLIEVGFAALGAGIMSLAIDIRSKNALDQKHKDLLDRYSRIKSREDQWRQDFDKFGEELDQLESLPRKEHFRKLQKIISKIEFDKEELIEEFGKWELAFSEIK